MADTEAGGIIDTLIGFPHGDMKEVYRYIVEQTRDAESRNEMQFPAEYMFKEVPERDIDTDDPIDVTLTEMDRCGVQWGMIGLSEEVARDAISRHPDRFVGSFEADPNRGVDCIRDIRRMKDEYDIRAVTVFPAGTNPQVAIDDRRMYPIYSTCVELDLPIFVCAGVPGPRVPMECQKVELIDRVMYDFPELVFVTRHGCEPWTDLAVKLMLKWPGLHYSTSAFAPKYYPKAIIDFANTRGAEKILYGGYFPMGLPLTRIVAELRDVPLREDVRPGFLRGNAARILRID